MYERAVRDTLARPVNGMGELIRTNLPTETANVLVVFGVHNQSPSMPAM